MARHITPNQHRVIEILREFADEGISPSYREIADRGNLNLAYVHGTVQSLVKKGAVSVKKGQRRGIRLKEIWRNSDAYDPKRVYPSAQSD